MQQTPGLVEQLGSWSIYRHTGKDAVSRESMGKECLPFYTNYPDLQKSSVIYAQLPGVLVTFKPKVTKEQIQQWFSQHAIQLSQQRFSQQLIEELGWKGKQAVLLSSDHAYVIAGVEGEEAIKLSNEIKEKNGDLIELTQPNWAVEVSLN